MLSKLGLQRAVCKTTKLHSEELAAYFLLLIIKCAFWKEPIFLTAGGATLKHTIYYIGCVSLLKFVLPLTLADANEGYFPSSWSLKAEGYLNLLLTLSQNRVIPGASSQSEDMITSTRGFTVNAPPPTRKVTWGERWSPERDGILASV